MSEILKFSCPACGASLTVPVSAAGRQGPCPRCQQRITAPAPEAQPEAEPAPAASKSLADPPVSRPRDPAPSVPDRRPAYGTLILCCAGFSALAAAGGYHFGRSRSAVTLEITPPPSLLTAAAQDPAAAPATPADAAEPAETAHTEDPPALPPATKIDSPPVNDPAPTVEATREAPPEGAAPPVPNPEPETVLRKFLAAPDLATRNALVLDPEKVRSLMSDDDAGPIAAKAVSLLKVDDNCHVFLVNTAEIPEGFPVAVARSEDGWRVDWRTFTEFHDDLFSKFAQGEAASRGVFNLMVRPGEAGKAEELYARFRIGPPMADREQTAWVKKDSIAFARLQTLFSTHAGIDEETFEHLMATTGVPMMLAISKNATNDGRSYLRIDEVVAINWGP